VSKKAIRLLMQKEIENYYEALALNNHKLCLEYLGRAHIVSQSYVIFHLYVHWLMLKYSVLIKDRKEISGQLLRLFVTVPGHVLKRVPIGNTGWSDKGLLQTMPLPEDLDKKLKELEIFE
jgi:hypothetical protein